MPIGVHVQLMNLLLILFLLCLTYSFLAEDKKEAIDKERINLIKVICDLDLEVFNLTRTNMY